MGVVIDGCETVVLGRTLVAIVEETMLSDVVTGAADLVKDDEVIANDGLSEHEEDVLATIDVEAKGEEELSEEPPSHIPYSGSQPVPQCSAVFPQ